MQLYDSNSIELTNKQNIYNSTIGIHLNNSIKNINNDTKPNLNINSRNERNIKTFIQSNNDYERDFNTLNSMNNKG